MVRALETPRTSKEAAAIISEAYVSRSPVTVVGAGSRRHWWSSPAQPGGPDLGVLVSATNLVSEQDVHAANLTAIFPAGTRLRDVHERLAVEGLWLPLLHIDSPEATLGGCVAAGFVNPLCLGHGLTRDWVLGLEVVSPQGRVLSLGGELVKNVAGYDLVRPHLGAWGRLGLLSRVTVRLLPLPEASALGEIRWECSVDAAGRVDDWIRTMLSGGAQPVALEVSAVPGGAIRVLADFVGSEASVTARVGAHGWDAVHVAGARISAWESYTGERGEAATALPWRARISVEVPGLYRVVSAATAAVGSYDWYLHGHAGSGVYWLFWRDERGPGPGLGALMRGFAGDTGGGFSIVAEGAAAALIQGTPGWIGFPPRPPRSQDAIEYGVILALSGGRPLNPHLPLASSSWVSRVSE